MNVGVRLGGPSAEEVQAGDLVIMLNACTMDVLPQPGQTHTVSLSGCGLEWVDGDGDQFA